MNLSHHTRFYRLFRTYTPSFGTMGRFQIRLAQKSRWSDIRNDFRKLTSGHTVSHFSFSGRFFRFVEARLSFFSVILSSISFENKTSTNLYQVGKTLRFEYRPAMHTAYSARKIARLDGSVGTFAKSQYRHIEQVRSNEMHWHFICMEETCRIPHIFRGCKINPKKSTYHDNETNYYHDSRVVHGIHNRCSQSRHSGLVKTIEFFRSGIRCDDKQ